MALLVAPLLFVKLGWGEAIREETRGSSRRSGFLG
jgi:hypothetical protein